MAVRITSSRSTADEWSLVLASAGIPSEVRPDGARWAVVVPEGSEAAAHTLLDLHDSEAQTSIATPAPDRESGRTYVAVITAALLVAFYVALAGTDSGPWYDAGTAYARRMLDGEWWRAVTALTLHASLAHVIGNAVALMVIGTGVCRELGPGLGLWLMLLAGTGGNALNAMLRGSPHGAVGASTAVFGAVGILGGLQVRRRSRRGGSARRVWAPFIAALGLLALLGTGPESDVLAHLFGFVVGTVLGSVAAARDAPLPRTLQWSLLITAVAVVLACWWAALAPQRQPVAACSGNAILSSRRA